MAVKHQGSNRSSSQLPLKGGSQFWSAAHLQVSCSSHRSKPADCTKKCIAGERQGGFPLFYHPEETRGPSLSPWAWLWDTQRGGFIALMQLHCYRHPDAAGWLRIGNCKAFISKVNNRLATTPLLGASTAVKPRAKKYFKTTDDCKQRLKLRAICLALFTRSPSFTSLPAETVSEQCSSATSHCSSWGCEALLELSKDEHSIPRVAWILTSTCNKSWSSSSPTALLWLWSEPLQSDLSVWTQTADMSILTRQCCLHPRAFIPWMKQLKCAATIPSGTRWPLHRQGPYPCWKKAALIFAAHLYGKTLQKSHQIPSSAC